MDTIWNQVLAEIQIEVSQPRFIAFFKSTHLVSLEKGVATIGSPNPMTADLLEKNYYALIKNILDKKTGENVSLLFTIEHLKKEEAKDVGPLFTLTPQPSLLKKRPAKIREDYTFDNFAVSDSNQLAYTAAYAVASDPGGKYNPLFLYGTVGVGKTHLMNAIANMVFEKNPNATIAYLTTEEFTNEMVEAIQTKSTNRLRKRFRSINLLLLDDIQFLSGKDKIQEELFHTFNSLIDNHGQVIFSSDRPPQEIKKIEARLASRFESGLTIDIAPPDFELRTAILLIKSKKHGIQLDTELAKRAAEKILDPRALEGFLLKLSTIMTMSGKTEITPELIDKSLGVIREERPSIHPDDVIRVVCEYFNIKTTQLKGTRRDAMFVKPRHICMYLLKEDFGVTLVEIGNLLGGRDHTTIMHGVNKIRTQKETLPFLMEDLKKIKETLQEET
jgi:chromosomal replication initiator protein